MSANYVRDDFLEESAAMGPQIKRTNHTTNKRSLVVRDVSTPYALPPTASKFSDDPALIVALILTAILLLLGLSATLCSGRLWRRPKRATSQCDTEPPQIQTTTTTPLTYAAQRRLCEPQNHDPILTYATPYEGNARPISYNIPTSSWGHGREAAASTLRLFSVPEVDEDQELEDSDPPKGTNPPVCVRVDDDNKVVWPPPGMGTSDGSPSSTTDTEIGPGIFDTASSDTAGSITSEGDEDEDKSDDESDGPEEVFEVKRGQTQSMELAKGVLLVVAPDSAPIVTTLPISSVPDDSGRMQLAIQRSRTAPNIQMQHVPALIVTEPSSFSLFTADSNTSQASMDLGTFPIPPLHLEPTIFWQQLEAEIHQSLLTRHRELEGVSTVGCI